MCHALQLTKGVWARFGASWKFWSLRVRWGLLEAQGESPFPQVPPQFLEYSHFGDEHYLTSLGQEVCGDEGIRRARRAETLGFLPLYLLKLVAGLLDSREGGLRAIYRLVMLVTFPGEAASTKASLQSSRVLCCLHFVRHLNSQTTNLFASYCDPVIQPISRDI